MPLALGLGAAMILATSTFLAVKAMAPAHAQDRQGGAQDDLAKKLAIPIASLISAPIHVNYHTGY